MYGRDLETWNVDVRLSWEHRSVAPDIASACYPNGISQSTAYASSARVVMRCDHDGRGAAVSSGQHASWIDGAEAGIRMAALAVKMPRVDT